MPRTSVTNLTNGEVLEWRDNHWVNTTRLVGVEASTIIAGSAAQGDILYFNGSKWARLAAGTDGQFLKTNGASANPQWSNVTSGWVGLNIDVTSASVNAGSAETTVKTYTLPGGTLGANEGLYIQILADSGSPQTLRVKFGGTTLITITTNTNVRMFQLWIFNKNSTTSQRVFGYSITGLNSTGSGGAVGNALDATDPAKNTGSDQVISLTLETDSNSGATVEGWTIHHVQ